MTGLVFFEWERCPDGYTVRTLKSEFFSFSDGLGYGKIASTSASSPEWVHRLLRGWNSVNNYELEQDYLVPNSSKVVKSNLLEGNDSAFLELAGVFESSTNVVSFVSKYGLLRPSTFPGDQQSWLEHHLLEDLQDEASFMLDMVSMWEMAMESNDYRVITHSFNSTTPFKRFNYAPELGEDHQSDFDEDRPGFVELHLQLRISPDGGRPTLYLEPKDLSEALWLQFVHAVTEGTDFQKCDECPTWFEASARKGKYEKKYCSNACSMQAYRKRKKKSKHNG